MVVLQQTARCAGLSGWHRRRPCRLAAAPCPQVMQKRRRLEQQCEQQQAEIKRLNVGMAQLRTDLQRINGLIAQNASLKLGGWLQPWLGLARLGC